MTLPRRSAPRILAVGGAVLLVLVATLMPVDGYAVPPPCLLCGDRWVADALANIALFVPLGMAMALVRGPRAPAWLAPVLLSAAIEVAQAAVIPGRDGSVVDLVTNSLGGAIGYLLAVHAHRWIWPARPRLAAATAAVVPLLFVALTGALAQPSFPRSVYWGQWTPQFGGFGNYQGSVTDASVGGMRIASRRLEWSAVVRERLLAGEPLAVRFVVGAAWPERLAPIVSIADEDQRMILLVGANGMDAELRVRRAAALVRLVQPTMPVNGAFLGLTTGDSAKLTVRRVGPAWCLRVEARESCAVGMTPGGGWRLLVGPGGLPRWAGAMGDALWLLLLLTLASFWGRGRSGIALALIVLGLACGLLPTMVGLDAATPLAWSGGALGVLVGVALRNRVARGAPNRLF